MKLTSHLHQLGTDGLKMLGNHVFDCDISHGGSCRQHKCTCLNLVGDNGVLGTMELLNSSDTDHICTCSLDIGSHAVEEVGNINHMRLLGSILDNCLALCHYCSHHDIDGGANADNIKINMLAHQLISLSTDDPLNGDLGSQCSKALDMLVDRAKSDVAASGKCHSRLLVFA